MSDRIEVRNTMLTAKEARELSGKTVEEKVESLLESIREKAKT